MVTVSALAFFKILLSQQGTESFFLFALVKMKTVGLRCNFLHTSDMLHVKYYSYWMKCTNFLSGAMQCICRKTKLGHISLRNQLVSVIIFTVVSKPYPTNLSQTDIKSKSHATTRTQVVGFYRYIMHACKISRICSELDYFLVYSRMFAFFKFQV